MTKSRTKVWGYTLAENLLVWHYRRDGWSIREASLARVLHPPLPTILPSCWFQLYFLHSTCTRGKWACGSGTCATVVNCPDNLVYRTDLKNCGSTCLNIGSCAGDEEEHAGCGCPDDYVIDHEVSFIFKLSRKQLNVTHFTIYRVKVMADDTSLNTISEFQ